MTLTQYRITVDATQSAIADNPALLPNWSEIAWQARERGYRAVYESRTVFDDFDLACVRDPMTGALPAGWMALGGCVITTWKVEAEIPAHASNAVLIG